MHKTINLRGVKQLINDIKAFRDNLNPKCDLALEKFADVGKDVASQIFTNATYSGINDVSVSTTDVVDHKIKVVAQGSAVAFIEFGAGVYYNAGNDYPNKPAGIKAIGEYGKKKGRQNTWGYYGVPGTSGWTAKNKKGEVIPGVSLTHGTPQARAMYQASKAIQDKANEIVAEVFKND